MKKEKTINEIYGINKEELDEMYKEIFFALVSKPKQSDSIDYLFKDFTAKERCKILLFAKILAQLEKFGDD